MDMKYKALIIAIVCLLAIYKTITSRRKISGLELFSVSYIAYWGFQYFFYH
jgi:uncharacterized membrane protein